jgi:TRAP-type transport system periplasmic protein
MRIVKSAGCVVLAGLMLPLRVEAQETLEGVASVNLKISGGNRTQNQFRYVYGPFFTEELPEKSGGVITTTFGSIEELASRAPRSSGS